MDDNNLDPETEEEKDLDTEEEKDLDPDGEVDEVGLDDAATMGAFDDTETM